VITITLVIYSLIYSRSHVNSFRTLSLSGVTYSRRLRVFLAVQSRRSTGGASQLLQQVYPGLVQPMPLIVRQFAVAAGGGRCSRAGAQTQQCRGARLAGHRGRRSSRRRRAWTSAAGVQQVEQRAAKLRAGSQVEEHVARVVRQAYLPPHRHVTRMTTRSLAHIPHTSARVAGRASVFFRVLSRISRQGV